MLVNIIFIILAYLVGSVNSAILICRCLRLPDPREQGSGNPGATNVLRISNKPTAATVLLLDVAKGVLVILLGRWLPLSPLWLSIIGLAVTVGHIYPLFFHFQGGKGVATAWGVILALAPTLAAITLGIWLLTATVSRYSSLAALCACVGAAVASLWLVPQYTVMLVVLTLLLIFTHRSNIQRLFAGTENTLR